MIEKDSWRIIEIIIRRYPYKKKEYKEYISDIIMSQPAANVSYPDPEEYTKPQSVTEAKALKLDNEYAEKLKKQIEAVELVYNNLNEVEQKLMNERFWKDRRKNTPYLKIKGVSYSERQMKRIVYKIIYQVGRYLGEIK